MSEGYNGWKNHATWNVALWIGNDIGLYRLAKSITSEGIRPQSDNYSAFVECVGECGTTQTPDGVAWDHSDLDIEALNEMMGEL